MNNPDYSDYRQMKPSLIEWVLIMMGWRLLKGGWLNGKTGKLLPREIE